MKKYLNERSMCLHSQSGFTPKEWFTLYTKFQNIEPRLVQIYNFNKKELSFEKEDIDGFVLSDTDEVKKLERWKRRKIQSEVISIWGTIQTFSVDDKHGTGTATFIHKDYCTNNLMYDTNKKQVRLIDPDAFHKESPGEFPPIWHGLFIETLYNTSQWEKYDHRLWDQP